MSAKVKVRKLKAPEDIRKKMIHIMLSEREMAELDEFREGTTRTEFIRQALKDKYDRIENPQLFMGNGASSNNDQISEFLSEIKTTNVETKKMLKKLVSLNEIKTILKSVQAMANKPEIEKNEKIIVELLREKKKLKPLKIIELTGLRNNEVYDVISNDLMFSINMNGEVILNE